MNAYNIKRAGDHGHFIIHGHSFVNAFLSALWVDWRFAQLEGLTLANVGFNADEFSHGNAEGMVIRKSTFDGCEFRRQRLVKCLFMQTVFKACDFTDADLSNATFVDTEFRDCRFTDTSFNNATFKWSLIHRCRMDSVHMKGVRLYGTSIPVDFCLSSPCCVKGEFPSAVMAHWARLFAGVEEDGTKLNKALHKIVVANAENKKELENVKTCPYCGNDLVLGHGPTGDEKIMCALHPRCSYTREITAKPL